MKVLSRVKDSSMVLFWCSGCGEPHQIDTAHWEFNGDFEKPTFSPSYLTWLDPNPDVLPGEKWNKYRTGFRCHSFIKDGMIEFLSDCTHDLSGQTIALSEWKL